MSVISQATHQHVTIRRPELTYAVKKVCQYMHDPKASHWQAVKKIVKCLSGTITYGLNLTKSWQLCLLWFWLGFGGQMWMKESPPLEIVFSMATISSHGHQRCNMLCLAQAQRLSIAAWQQQQCQILLGSSTLWVNCIYQLPRPQDNILWHDNLSVQPQCCVIGRKSYTTLKDKAF